MTRLTHLVQSGKRKAQWWSAAKKPELIDRLAAYENTELEPEQIEQLKRIVRRLNVEIDRLRGRGQI